MKHKLGKAQLYTLFICLLCVSTIGVQSYTHKHASLQPKPTSEDEQQEENKKAYIEHRHRAAPGTNWRQIEATNAWNTYSRLQRRSASRTTSTFADGLINGVWYERGNDNLAGRMDAFAFLPGTNTLYGTSDGGSVWKTSLPATAWTKISDAAEFQPYTLGAIQRGTGSRLFLSAGLNIWRTDDEGSTFDTSSTGITFPVAWGGNYIYNIIPVNDVSHTVYCITFEWDNITWTPLFSLYSSTDSGVTYSRVRNFPYHSTNQLSFASPVGSGTLYALGVTNAGNDTLFSITNSVVSVASVATVFPDTANVVSLSCMQYGGTTHFYALVGGTSVYHSTNFGTTWNLQSTFAEDDSYIIGVSSADPNDVIYGNVNASRSTDSGATWALINSWTTYYGAPATNLHADIRAIQFFQYAGGTEFGMIGTDGGAYITNDEAATVNNISLTGLHVNQLWDHITSPTDTSIIFGGAQDQGLQTSNAAGGTGIIDETQVISGDYGQLRITGGGNTLWILYPGGSISLYNTLSSPTYLGTWDLTGTQKPEDAWMMPTADFFNSGTQDNILVGGGNITGDSGSYLIELSLAPSGSFSVTPTQYPYNFRVNSNDGTSGISAIAVSTLSSTLMYVAAEDGTFFYSTDAGTTWAKTGSFAGLAGNWLYGACITPSADSVNTVYFAGSGYSNPPVYVSKDHGLTFTPMSYGLPPTLVNSMAILGNDSLIFAATEAGPYVYVKADTTWYSLADATTPVQNWRSVEYIAGANLIRYGTYGRGVWDLRLGNSTIPNAVHPVVTASDLKIGPNPVKSGGLFTIFSASQQSVHLTVYTMDGNMVLDQQAATNSAIAVPGLAPGIYIYSCETAPGIPAQNGMLSVSL